MTTGTGPFAFAGVLKLAWISMVICGHAALSTCPTSFFVGPSAHLRHVQQVHQALVILLDGQRQ